MSGPTFINLSSPQVTTHSCLLGWENARSFTPPTWASIYKKEEPKHQYKKKQYLVEKAKEIELKHASKCWRRSFNPWLAYKWIKCFVKATPATTEILWRSARIHLNDTSWVLWHIPIKFPSGLHDTQLMDIDESLANEACKRLSVNILLHVLDQYSIFNQHLI